MSDFERRLKKEMEKNLRGQESDNPYPCPNCGTGFKLPGQVVMFGGEVTCPNCGQVVNIESDAANTITSALKLAF